jgi:large subunit ribosomal protein L46
MFGSSKRLLYGFPCDVNNKCVQRLHTVVPCFTQPQWMIPSKPKLLQFYKPLTLHGLPMNDVSLLYQQQQHHQCRTMANVAKQSKKKEDNPSEATLSYWEQKKANKDRRRELYISRQERKQRVKVRRAGKPQDTKKIDFQTFFIQKKVTDEHFDRKARQAGLEWKIRVAVLLERLNVVLPDKEPWEVEYDNLRTHLNRFGKQYPKEFTGNFDYDQKRPMTDEELLASLPFKPAPRETEADASGDVRTTNRKLKTNIFLTVQDHANSNNDLWQFPTVDVKENETLLSAAQRAIPEQLGSDIEFWCPSNCPWSVHLTPYTDEERKVANLYGIKTFFMKLQYDEGDVSTKEMTIKDFAWLDRQEMADRVNKQQGDHMSKFYYYML